MSPEGAIRLPDAPDTALVSSVAEADGLCRLGLVQHVLEAGHVAEETARKVLQAGDDYVLAPALSMCGPSSCAIGPCGPPLF